MKSELAATFLMVDMGPISFYLELKVQCNREKRILKLSQPAYVDKILEKFHLDKANAVQTPMKEEVLFMPRIEDKTSASK